MRDVVAVVLAETLAFTAASVTIAVSLVFVLVGWLYLSTRGDAHL